MLGAKLFDEIARIVLQIFFVKDILVKDICM